MTSKWHRSLSGILALILLSFTVFGVAHVPSALAQNDVATSAQQPKSTTATTSSPTTPSKSTIDQNVARDGKIAQLVGRILEQYHYTQASFNDQVSQRMVKSYMDELDYTHSIFLQTDLDEFMAKYGNQLDKFTTDADATPAFVIFKRFLQRLDQRIALVEKLLKEKYDFTGTDRFTPNREKAAFPKDDADAEQIWRSRIKFELLQGKLNNDKPEDTIKKISHRYSNLRKDSYDVEEDEVLQYYLNGLAHSYDPHSDYMTPEEAEDFDINAIKLSLSGIGAVLRPEDGYAKIERVVPGSPAENSKKLKAGDRIIAVAQGSAEFVDVIDMKLKKVVKLIRGPQGTTVRLMVLPAGQSDPSLRKEVDLVRDEVKISDQLAKAQIIEHRTANGSTIRVGVINLPQFYDKTVADCSKLLERLKREQVAGVILDLRRNGGGLLDQAIDLTGLFTHHGPVVQVRNSNGQINTLRTEDVHQLYPGPLIVLVGHLSASASEIVAGALQDYNRAVIVGDASTHGKGTVQTLLPLERWVGFGFRGDPGKLKLTVQKFYRIAGGSTQQKGVIPDIQLPSLLDYLELGERTLPNCLPYDTVDKVDYDSFNQATPYIAELKQRSVLRIGQSHDFNYVKQDIEVLKKRLADKSVSLNEEQRKKEKADLLAQAKSRKLERDARTTPPDKAYELTLDDVDKNKPLDQLTLVSVVAAQAQADKEKDKDKENKDLESALDEDSSVDPQLDETVNILVDYAALLTDKNALANKAP